MRLLVTTTIVIVLAAGALLGGTFDEGGASAAPSLEAQRAATRGLTLQQQARVSGNPALYPRAEQALEKALRLDPRNGQALRGLSALAASRHRFSESLALARRAQALEPDVAAVHGLIGDANLELGRYNRAFAAFDRLAALKPSVNAYARISYARELRGDTSGAIEAMELAVDASIGAAEPSAWSRTLLGNLLLADRRPAEAKLLFREALAFVPGYPGALSSLAELRTGTGDLEGAAALYRRAAAGAPVPEFAGSLGDTLAALGRSREAERAWRTAESLERLFAANGGRNLLETAEFDLNHDRNLRSALDRARRGRSERPSVEGDHVLAWALYKNDLCAEARQASLRSLRLGTLDVDGLYHHSLIEACLGNRAAAAEYRARVERLDPQYLDAPPSASRLGAAGVKPR
jgi:tetratricopeptide (TPR) repeat protein